MSTQQTRTQQQTRGGPKPNVNPPGARTDKPLVPMQERKLVARFAARYHVEPDKLLKTLKDTAFKQPYKDGKPGPEITDEQMMALLIVADEYKLNPFTKEIYAFPAKGGGIVPIISIDGWITMINRQPELESIEFFYPEDPNCEQQDYYVTCSIKRKDRSAPITITEYFRECARDTDPWRDTGRRMNRHRALIQCARIAFGFSGVHDPDEGRNIYDSEATEITPPRGKPETTAPQSKLPPPAAAAASGDMFDQKTPREQIQALLDSKGIPENELFAYFEIGGWDELKPDMELQAIDWLKRLNAPPE